MTVEVVITENNDDWYDDNADDIDIDSSLLLENSYRLRE